MNKLLHIVSISIFVFGLICTGLITPVRVQSQSLPPSQFILNPAIFIPLATASPTAPPVREIPTTVPAGGPTTAPKVTPTPVPTTPPAGGPTTQPQPTEYRPLAETPVPTLKPTFKPTFKPVTPIVTVTPSASPSTSPLLTPAPSVLGTTDEQPPENKNATGLIASAGIMSLILLKRVTRSIRRRRLGSKIPSTIAAGCLLALPAISDLYELYCNTKDIRDSFGTEES